MLQHLRPVKVALTPLHLRVLFRESVLALGFALALERESPSLHPFPESRVGGWQVRWCVSCVLMVQLPRQPVLASEQPGFGSSAARLFPVASATGDRVDRLRGGILAVHTRPVSGPRAISRGRLGYEPLPAAGSSFRWPKM